MFFRLKDLIRAVRVCKTATDERNVIRRESAAIRTSFKEAESQDVRYVNVQKLVYIYLLGQPVQFGQLECLKLAASARFADKRVGYLGVGLLVDETQEILTLLTNSLKTDLHSSDDYVVGLALGALASVASAEVAGDLADEVQRLAGSARAYVRKKAGLAAVRVVQRAPDAADAFVAAARALVGDRHHGVRLAGAALLEELSGRSAAAADAAAALVPELARQLRELATGAGGGEHGVRGIGDPFLQAALLRLVRVAARGSAAAADAAGDVLALVGAQDDAAGNVATALLYECAVTALAIPAGAALRGLAVNVLGRLLARADNNARCVALGALATAVVADAAAVQRHRATVLARLRDDDATIRRRALDLAFALVDADNAPAVVREILRALPHVDADQRASAAYRLAAAVALFAASREWHVDRMLRLLAVAGAHVRARDLFRFLRLVATADAPLQRRAARAAFALLERDVSQDKLVQAGVWLTGEYADLLVPADSQASANDSANASAAEGQASAAEGQASAGLDADGLDILGALGAPVSTGDKALAPDEPLDLDADLPQPAPAPAAVVRLLASVARAPAVSPAARHMALTALAKAAGRFAALPAVVASVRAALAQHTHAVDAEQQARAAEFDALLRRELDSVRAAVVERMPPPEYAEVPYDEYVLNPAAMRMKALTLFRPPELIAADPAADPAALSAARAEASRQSVVSDLLNLMDEAPAPSPQPQPAVADLLAATSLSPPADAVAYPVFHQHGLRLTLTPSKRAAHVVDLRADFTNTGDSAVSGLAFQVAVPKSQKIQIHPPSGQHISAGSSVSQLLRVSNPTQAQLRLRMKIAFTADAQTHEHMLDFSGFPSTVV